MTSMGTGQLVTRQIKCACDSLQNHCLDEADYCISNYTVSKKKEMPSIVHIIHTAEDRPPGLAGRRAYALNRHCIVRAPVHDVAMLSRHLFTMGC